MLALLRAVTLLCVAALSAACTSADQHALERSREPTGGLATPADFEQNAIAGAFYNDGSDTDVRNASRASLDEATRHQPADRAPTGQPSQRMLVQQGEITIEVRKTDEAIAAFLAKIAEYGGYLKQQSGAAVTVRVPAARFDDAFAWLRAAGRVLRELRHADDVTEEFLDLGIRIDNAQRARDRLLEVLKTATKVEDVLAVERELRRLTEELERMEGRRKYLTDQVAMATLQATFSAVAEAPPPPKQKRQPSRFAWINRIGAERVLEDF